VTSIAIEDVAFHVDPPIALIPPGASVPVELSFGPQVAGPVASTLTFTSNDPHTPRLEIPFTAWDSSCR